MSTNNFGFLANIDHLYTIYQNLIELNALKHTRSLLKHGTLCKPHSIYRKFASIGARKYFHQFGIIIGCVVRCAPDHCTLTAAEYTQI